MTLRHSMLRRRTPLRSSWKPRAGKRSDRRHDDGFLKAVRKLPCIVRELPPPGAIVTPCYGEVQPDHMGSRPVGRKADDRTAVPMCRRHHGERTDHSGTFRELTRDELRSWRVDAIEHTQREVNHLQAGMAA